MESKKLLRIKNFRSLEDIEIEIRPLTLLFGKNGSGKSSLLKAIKFLGENTLPPEYNKPTKYDFEEFNLGSFNEMVTKNDLSRKIEMEFSVFEKPLSNWVKDQINSAPEKKDELVSHYSGIMDQETGSGKKFRVQFGDNPKGMNLEQFEFSYASENDRDPINYTYIFKYQPKQTDVLFDSTDDGIVKNNDVCELFIWLLKHWGNEQNLNYRDWGTGHPDDPLVELESRIDSLKLDTDSSNSIFKVYNDFFLEFNKILLSFFPKEYLSTTRLRPEYRYFLNQGYFDSKEYYGLLNQFCESEKLLNSINEVLEKFDLAKEVEIEKVGEVGKIVTFSPNGSKFNLAEANSGIQRSLPIIAFNELNSETNILLEQPEIELHPKLQCQMIEYLSEGKNKFIIETHSEHIVRKIQVLIAQGKLKKEKVAVYYFDKDKETGITSIKEMELEDNGFFKEPWPDGFFDDSYNLARELIYARKN